MSGLSEGRLKGAIRDALNDRNRVGRKDLTGETIPVAAAYLLELGARIDKDYHRSERARIQDLLRHCFRLTDLEAKRLLIEAESLYVDEADWLEQVRRLDQQFSMAERETLMDMMWDVIHSDGIVRDSEVMLMDNVSWLLQVTEEESTAIRKKVAQRWNME